MHRALPEFADGGYLVELAPLSDPDNIVSAITDAVGYQFQSDGRDPKAQLLNFLANKHMLLLLDNFEHLLGGARLVTDILQNAPNVHILATSRVRLSQTSETLFHLSGMEFPDWETPADALAYAAVKLFVNSAKRAKPDFELKDAHLTFVARICRLIQGMPLGIVLSASWLAMLTLQEITDEIAQGIDFLETDATDLPERQRSIRAVMDYSWNQMTHSEQKVFMKLSIFRGGFTREASEQVAGANLRLLRVLVNKSLLRRHADNGRYEIHELLRQYAEEKLDTSSEGEATHKAYSKHFLNVLGSQYELLRDHRARGAADIIEIEFANIITAWQWALKMRHYDWLSECVYTWNAFGAFNKNQAETYALWVETIDQLEQDSGHNMLLARLWVLRGNLEFSSLGRKESAKQYAQATTRMIEHGETLYDVYLGWLYSARIASNDRNFEKAWENTQKAYAVAETLGDKADMGGVRGFQSFVASGAGMGMEVAFQLAQQAYKLFAEVGNQPGMAHALGNMGAATREQGDYDLARRYAWECVQIQTHLNIIGRSVYTLVNYCDELFYAGDFEMGEVYLAQADALARDQTNPVESGRVLTLKSFQALVYDQIDDSLRFAQEALALAEKGTNYTMLSACRRMLRFAQMWAGHYDEGQLLFRELLRDRFPATNTRDLSSVIQCALPFLAHKGEIKRAVTLLSLVFNHSRVQGYIEKSQHLARFRRELQEQVDSQVFQDAWERGKLLDLETAVQELLDEFGVDTASN